MRLLNLVMGDDSRCKLCTGDLEREAVIFNGVPEFPWDLCPTHFGELTDDPEISAMCDMVESWPEKVFTSDTRENLAAMAVGVAGAGA